MREQCVLSTTNRSVFWSYSTGEHWEPNLEDICKHKDCPNTDTNNSINIKVLNKSTQDLKTYNFNRNREGNQVPRKG